MWIIVSLLLAASPAVAVDESLLERATRFRSLVQERRFEAARSLMAEDPRRWWETREGAGAPWTLGEGRWSAWDEHFASESEIVGWREENGAATAVIRESNDYYRLLERGALLNEVTYFFDADGKIEGLLIRAAGERPAGLTDDFRRWAAEHAPEELEAVMPGGEIDPSDPARFRALLNRWRVATGRQPIPQRSGVHPDRAGEVEAMVTRYGGTFAVDDSSPDAPIVAIDLHRTEVTDADLALLAGLTSLRELDLRLTSVSDAGIRNLASLTRLEKLNLFRTRLTDDGLASLAGLTELRTLLIGGTGVTDAGIAHLRGMSRLRKISVFDTAVGDGAIAAFAPLTSLEVLLIGKSKITEAGAAELQRLNPNLSFAE